MRYTTIIDISETVQIYRSTNIRLLYLHLCLKAGYHDTDRDIVDLSIRQLAKQTQLSLSATRHALRILERAGLIIKQGNAIQVRKYIMSEEISSRPKTKRQQQLIDAAVARKREQEQRDLQAAVERKEREELATQGKSAYILYCEGLLARMKLGDQEAAQAYKRHEAAYKAATNEMNKKKN